VLCSSLNEAVSAGEYYVWFKLSNFIELNFSSEADGRLASREIRCLL
jgi:hypothetical protein